MSSKASTGRARAVLVFDRGDDARAVISAIVVRARKGLAGKRLRCVGPAIFEPTAMLHISRVVLPLVDGIVTALGQPRMGFELSVVNLGAASATDRGMQISGFSADLPIFLALLSAALGLPVPQDLVCTGHIASSVGDIAAVRAIPSKLAAAALDNSIRRFVLPALDQDGSLETLLPGERQRVADATMTINERLRIVPIPDVGELVQVAFADEPVLWASFRLGFFVTPQSARRLDGAIGVAARHLGRENEERFWTFLEQHLLAGANEQAARLLSARVRLHVAQRTYPGGLGRRLLDLVRSLPPRLRHRQVRVPLLSMQHCIRLSQFAGQRDYADVRALHDAVFTPWPVQRASSNHGAGDERGATPESATRTLEAVLAELDREYLSRSIALPIDTARASYQLDRVTVRSYWEFLDIVTAFYLHLVRHVRLAVNPVSDTAVTEDALDLLGRAFAGKGGADAAQAEAKHGTHGGLRYVLDVLTEQLKAEQLSKFVERVLKEALDPQDWDAKVAFISALLARIGPQLPPEIRDQPPARFARCCEPLVKAYVESLDRVKEAFRAF